MQGEMVRSITIYVDDYLNDSDRISMSNSNPNLEAGSSAGQRVLVWK